MKRPDSRAGTIHSAGDLWQAIVQKAGLDLDGYDRPLIAELSEKLEVSAKDFAAELDRAGVTAEALLVQLLSLIAPYAAMMQDILAFFARAGARATTENIRVHFEFDSINDSLEFDLHNFQDWEIQFRQAVARVFQDEIDDFHALQIRHTFLEPGVTYQIFGSTWSDLEPSDPDVARWLIESRADPARLVALPPPPDVVNRELRLLLDRVWRLLRKSVLRATSNLNPQVLTLDDVRTIVRGAYLLYEEEGLLLSRLREAFIGIQAEEIEATVLIKELVEVFNLPVWKRRSELYSVWVAARLITAFGEDVRVHVVDRSIVFSFRGAHLATVRVTPQDNLHVWCEFRTRVSEVIGKGRRRAIQPDYVVLCEPTSHPNSAVLIVECKQYLCQSQRRFADALIDYANGHRRAEVVLVNYGPVTSSVLERVRKVDASLLTRTQIIGKLRPGSQPAIREFEELVRSVASSFRPPAGAAPEKIVQAPALDAAIRACAGNVRLSWQADVDLDLHCWITNTQGDYQHVYYDHLLGNHSGSRVELDRDVRTGGGVETLTWENADSVHLDFAVYAYSPESDISSAKPHVEANVGDSAWAIQPPEGQQGRWWRLFRIERGGPIRIWNSIGSKAPFEDMT